MLSALLALTLGALPAPDGVSDFAHAVAHAGDVDDDGYGDVLVAWRDDGDWVGLYRGSALGLVSEPAWVTAASTFASAGDVDGDGFGDIIVGDPNFVFDDQVVGRAVVHFGGEGGVDDRRPPWVVLGEGADERLGAAVGAAGDFDGDGFGDIIIGSPGFDHGRGRARIFRGDHDRPIAGPAWVGLGDSVGAAFGAAVGTAWDVDADGRSDTFVSAVGGAGLVAMVYLQSADSVWSVGARRMIGVGDSDGDGFADIVLTSSTSAVHFGGHDLEARTPQALDDGCPLGPAGDVNGDGYADVVGAVIYFGTPVGPGAATRALDGCGTGVGDVDGDGFGDVMVGAEVVRGAWSGLAAEAEWRYDDARQAVAARDIDGDGFDDLLLADAAFTSDGLTLRGRVQLFQGSALGPAQHPSWTHIGDAAGEALGASVSGTGDVDGDGYPDVLVGSPGANPERDATGKAQLFWGGRAGIDLDRAPAVVLPRASDYRLGSSGEGVGDLDGDGFADVVVGVAPYRDIGGGKLDAYRGESGGLATQRSWRIARVPVEAPNASFYRPRALGDVDGDGLADFGMYCHYRVAEAFFGDPVAVVVQRGITWGGALHYDYNEVTGAGDFDGDGRGDMLFASYSYADGDGLVDVRTFDMASLRSLRGEPKSETGFAIAAAGDVDNDGFADVILGAPGASDISLQSGRVWIWFGADATRVWSFAGQGAGARLGEVVGTPGDLDGDGFPEVMLRSRESRTTLGGDHVRIFRGNGGLGFGAAYPYRMRARRPGTGIAIPAWGMSDNIAGFDITGHGRSPHGAGRVVLEAEIRPSAERFIGVITQRSDAHWSDLRPAELSVRVRGLAEDSAYRWRARVRVDPAQAPIQGWSRWLYGGLPGQPSGVHVRTSKNHAPIVRDESYDFNEDENGKGEPAPGLLANDLDRDGHALTATKLTETRHGDVTVLPDGGWFYVPDDGYRGPDGFDYRVSDGRGGSADGHVDLYVAPGSDCLGASRARCEAGELRAVIATTSGPRGLRCRVIEGDARALSCAFDERPGGATCEAP